MRLAPLMVIAVLAAVMLSGPTRAQEAPAAAVAYRPPMARSGLFGTEEVYSADNAAFSKWNGMLARHRAQLAEAGTCESCVAASEWHELVARLSPLPFQAKLEAVNAAINRHPYVTSMRNWGESNRWETPFEFLRRGGQCQDYAIAKYLALRDAGVPADRLRLVVLRDMRLGIDHAVTVAYGEGEAWVLDNQSAALAPADSLLHYQPYYSISEQGWWLHRGPHARYAAAGANAPLN